jgi:hemoglobin
MSRTRNAGTVIATLIRVTARKGATIAAGAQKICVGAHSGAPASAAPTLYARLGGEAGVSAIATALIDRVSADPRLGRSFQDTNLKRIKKLLAEQLCDLAGGPCHYSGDPMKEVHAGHHISEAEFYGMVQTLRDILHERHIDTASTNELLRLLAPMKRDVVEPAQAEAHR